MTNIKKKYISPLYSPVMMDETSSLVSLSPPHDNEIEFWEQSVVDDQNTQTDSPFMTMDFRSGSTTGSPFDTGSIF